MSSSPVHQRRFMWRIVLLPFLAALLALVLPLNYVIDRVGRLLGYPRHDLGDQ